MVEEFLKDFLSHSHLKTFRLTTTRKMILFLVKTYYFSQGDYDSSPSEIEKTQNKCLKIFPVGYLPLTVESPHLPLTPYKTQGISAQALN